MKVALVSDWFLPRLGGIELQMRDLALQLRSHGHDVEIITSFPGPGQLDGMTVHRLGAPRLPGAGIVFGAAAFRQIREILAADGYDAVHVHFGIIAPLAYGATFVAQSLGLPTVATFHSVLTHFDIPLWLVRGAMGVPDWRVSWTAVSNVVADSIRPLIGTRPVAILANGIDVGWWSPGPRPASDGLRAISVMRLHRRKRPRALLRLTSILARRLPHGMPLELRIVGDGAERPALERLISRLGLEHVVTLHGWMSQESVRRELHRSDLFLLPSRLEAFGIAALEARCAGLPVVAMARSGARDFLTDGHDSLLARDDAEFSDHVARFATDPHLRRRLLAAAAVPPGDADWSVARERIERAYRDARRA